MVSSHPKSTGIPRVDELSTGPSYLGCHIRGVNLPLGEKALFLEERSINLPASFSLGEMNLPHGEVVLYAPFSLRGINSS